VVVGPGGEVILTPEFRFRGLVYFLARKVHTTAEDKSRGIDWVFNVNTSYFCIMERKEMNNNFKRFK